MSRRLRAAERRDDHPCDAYSTPAWCVDRLLDAWGGESLGPRWLEPAAGDGAIVRAVDGWMAANGLEPRFWTTMDIRPEANAMLCGDFTGLGRPLLDRFAGSMRDRRFDVCITNPPYTQADAFVAEAMARAHVVAMLLRLNWLAGARHAAWLQRHPPDVYVLPDRPSFDGQGTDATDYAWLAWHGQRRGSLYILDPTPLEERRRR